MSWMNDFLWLDALAKSYDPSIELHTKDNWFQYAIAWILFLITFGRFKRQDYLTRFATTVGNHHYYPKEYTKWQVERILPHEARHTRQFRWFGLMIHPLLGLPVAMLVYLFLPLPVFMAWGRFWMELDADRASYRHRLREMGYATGTILQLAARKSEVVSGPSYFWAVPEAWARHIYIDMAKEVIDEYEDEISAPTA